MLHPINWSLALPYYAAAFCFGYLLGSIPFGLLITRLAGTRDLRQIGSGNIGATNVLRTGRKELAILTLVCDVLKGTLAVVIADHIGGQDLAILAALGAFLGHLFPVWLRFRGGKGVATAAGAVLGIDPLLGAATLATWLIIAAFFRYSSLASIVAAVFAPFWRVLTDGPDAIALALLVIGGLLIWRHSANIKRLFAGTESRIGGMATTAAGAAPGKGRAARR
jgi:glycerol-3-phosphate acyltransferase PlsY